MSTNTADITGFYSGQKPVEKLYVGAQEVWGSVPAVTLPSYGSSSTLVYSIAPAGSVNYTLPVCADGDLIVLSLMTLNITFIAPTTPTGWTLAHTAGGMSGAYPVYSRTYIRRKQAGDPGAVTMLNGESGKTFAFIHAHAFSGVSIATPTTGTAGHVADTVNPMSVTAASITPAVPSIVVYLLSSLNQATSPTLSPPSFGVERNNQSTVITNTASGMSTIDVPTPGVVSGPSWTISPNANGNPYFEVVTLALAA